MNTKQRNRLKSKMRKYNASRGVPDAPIDAKTGQPLADLISTLQSVDMKSKDAKENENSMDDNNGGRILYPWLWNTSKKDKEEIKK